MICYISRFHTSINVYLTSTEDVWIMPRNIGNFFYNHRTLTYSRWKASGCCRVAGVSFGNWDQSGSIWRGVVTLASNIVHQSDANQSKERFNPSLSWAWPTSAQVCLRLFHGLLHMYLKTTLLLFSIAPRQLQLELVRGAIKKKNYQILDIVQTWGGGGSSAQPNLLLENKNEFTLMWRR